MIRATRTSVVSVHLSSRRPTLTQWLLKGGDLPVFTRQIRFARHRGNSLESARQGKWKIRRAGKKKDGAELYDLERDISEKKNLVDENHDLIRKKLKQMNIFHDALVKSR